MLTIRLLSDPAFLLFGMFLPEMNTPSHQKHVAGTINSLKQLRNNIPVYQQEKNKKMAACLLNTRV